MPWSSADTKLSIEAVGGWAIKVLGLLVQRPSHARVAAAAASGRPGAASARRAARGPQTHLPRPHTAHALAPSGATLPVAQGVQAKVLRSSSVLAPHLGSTWG